MKDLIPKTVAAKLPALYSQENVADPLVHVKLFALGSGATWYVTEYSPEDKLAFGFVCGLDEDEMGYMSIKEMEALRFGPIPRIERDTNWEPVPLSRVREAAAQQRPL